VSRPLEDRDGPALHVDFDQLLPGVDFAFTASSGPTWAESIVRGRIPVAEGVEVFHYAEPVRLDGIVNELYMIRDDGPVERHRVELPERARSTAGGSV
jgi:hypothetical protein